MIKNMIKNKSYNPERKLLFRDKEKIISLVKGNIFYSKMKYLVIPVNCVGTMGCGLAQATKRKDPQVEKIYIKKCAEKKIQLGKPLVVSTNNSLKNQKKYILFATKDDWHEPFASREGIKEGLSWLIEFSYKQPNTTIAVPALGCGAGKLQWEEIFPIIVESAMEMKGVIALYSPKIPKKRKI